MMLVDQIFNLILRSYLIFSDSSLKNKYIRKNISKYQQEMIWLYLQTVMRELNIVYQKRGLLMIMNNLCEFIIVS